jgi:hypothetical protein
MCLSPCSQKKKKQKQKQQSQDSNSDSPSQDLRTELLNLSLHSTPVPMRTLSLGSGCRWTPVSSPSVPLSLHTATRGLALKTKADLLKTVYDPWPPAQAQASLPSFQGSHPHPPLCAFSTTLPLNLPPPGLSHLPQPLVSIPLLCLVPLHVMLIPIPTPCFLLQNSQGPNLMPPPLRSLPRIVNQIVAVEGTSPCSDSVQHGSHCPLHGCWCTSLIFWKVLTREKLGAGLLSAHFGPSDIGSAQPCGVSQSILQGPLPGSQKDSLAGR